MNVRKGHLGDNATLDQRSALELKATKPGADLVPTPALTAFKAGAATQSSAALSQFGHKRSDGTDGLSAFASNGFARKRLLDNSGIPDYKLAIHHHMNNSFGG